MRELQITMGTFEEEVLKNEGTVLVDFWAPWCVPCKMLAPIIEEIAKEYEGRITVGKVNIDDEFPIAAKYGVTGVPTLILFHKGEVVKKSVGLMSKEEVEEFLK